MISFVEGRVAERSGDRVVVAAGGLGYEVLVPSGTMAAMPPTGEQIRLLTHLHVREDGMTLYGFSSGAERTLFLSLIGVTGVGPKVALAVLSALSVEALHRAILDGDADAITVVPGIGKKVAARIVLDLRDKLGGETELPAAGPLAEVRDALAHLGLTPQEAQRAVEGIHADGQPVEELLREALRRVGAAT